MYNEVNLELSRSWENINKGIVCGTNARMSIKFLHDINEDNYDDKDDLAITTTKLKTDQLKIIPNKLDFL